jgi:hypothetical protein
LGQPKETKPIVGIRVTELIELIELIGLIETGGEKVRSCTFIVCVANELMLKIKLPF